MTNAKIEFTIGGISFSGEGEEAWLTSQLDKIIDKAEELVKIAHSLQTTADTSVGIAAHEAMKKDSAITSQTLSSFLKDKNATKSQRKKFLATAVWLQERGQKRLVTSDITQALKDSNQARLGNASAELGRHVTKGNIERDGNQFFVTEQGKASL